MPDARIVQQAVAGLDFERVVLTDGYDKTWRWKIKTLPPTQEQTDEARERASEARRLKEERELQECLATQTCEKIDFNYNPKL